MSGQRETTPSGRARPTTWVERVRAERSAGTISLRGLPHSLRLVSVAALIGVIATLAALIPNLLMGWWPTPVVRIPGQLLDSAVPGRTAIPLYILSVVVLGIAAAALAASGAGATSTWRRRLIFGSLGGFAVVVGATMVDVADLIEVFEADLAARLIRFLGLTVMVDGVVLAILPGRAGRSVPMAAGLAAFPFAAAALAALLVAGVSGTVPFGTPDPRWPARIDGLGFAAGTMVGLVELGASLIGVLFLWQSVIAARAVRRQIGRAAARRATRAPGLLLGLLGAKLVYVVAGLAGLLPAILRGGDPDRSWVERIMADPIGLMVAVVLVAMLTLWLLRGSHPPISSRAVGAAAAFYVIGFNLPAILASLVILVLPVVGLISADFERTIPAHGSFGTCLEFAAGNLSLVTACISSSLADLIPHAGLATWALGWIVIAWMARRRRWPEVAAFGAIGLWVTPVAIARLREFLGSGPVTTFGRPDLLSIDFLLTGVIAILAVLWWVGRQHAVAPGAMSLLLVVATLLGALGAATGPSNQTLIIGLVLLVTAAYELLFDSESVNTAGAERAELLPRVLGLQLLGLGILLAAIAFDRFAAPGADLAELFVPPVLAVLLLADVSRRRRGSGPDRRRPRPIRTAVAPALIGAVFALSTLALLRLVAIPPQTAPVASGYGEFVQRVDVARVAAEVRFLSMQAAAAGTEAEFVTASQDFAAFVTEEEAWLGVRQPAACYAAEFARWESIVTELAAIRDAVAAGTFDLPALERYVAANKILDAGGSECQSVVPASWGRT